MKKMMMTLAAFAVLMFAEPKCPVDDNSGYFTGTTRSVSGVLMKEYKCPQGHIYWVRA